MEISRAGRPQALCRSVQGLQGGSMSSDPEAGTREGIGPGSFTHPDAARPKQRLASISPMAIARDRPQDMDEAATSTCRNLPGRGDL